MRFPLGAFGVLAGSVLAFGLLQAGAYWLQGFLVGQPGFPLWEARRQGHLVLAVIAGDPGFWLQVLLAATGLVIGLSLFVRKPFDA